jgi:uncharacterized protein YndB with AHSA1/START domain
MGTEQQTIGETTFATPSDREVVITRVFDAPREVVFEAMTSPEHVPNWYGPRGFTLPVCEIDFRPGGAWRYVTRAPDGSEMGMRGVYQEIEPPERIVSTESFDDYPGESLNAVVLTEEDGRTRVTTTVRYESKEIRDAVIASGMQAGAAETYDRLAEHVATLVRGS